PRAGPASRSPAFPYTTLFRSRPAQYLASLCENRRPLGTIARASRPICWALDAAAVRMSQGPYCFSAPECIEEEPDEEAIIWCLRSEEHTSELQSRVDLVCRLL